MSSKSSTNTDVSTAQASAARLHRKIQALGPNELDLLFREARSHNGWTKRQVPESLIRSLYALTKMSPTCANSCPARFVFVTSAKAKQLLGTTVAAANFEKVISAPVIAIIGHDLNFYHHLGRLFAHNPGMQAKYADDPMLAELTALRNSTLQGAWLMMAARSLGLDCGPMSGFDNAAVDKLFFGGSTTKSNFLCALGYGDPEKLFERLPRFEFDEVCEIR